MADALRGDRRRVVEDAFAARRSRGFVAHVQGRCTQGRAMCRASTQAARTWVSPPCSNHSCEQEEPMLSADPLHQRLPLTIDTRRYSARRT